MTDFTADEAGDHYTPEYLQVVQQANQLAFDQGYTYIGPEHLLVAMSEVDCMAAEVLKQYQADEHKLNYHLRRFLGDTPKAEATTPPPWNDAARDAQRYARKLAEQMESSRVGTEHLLVGIINRSPANSTAMGIMGVLELPREGLVHAVQLRIRTNAREYADLQVALATAEATVASIRTLMDRYRPSPR